MGLSNWFVGFLHGRAGPPRAALSMCKTHPRTASLSSAVRHLLMFIVVIGYASSADAANTYNSTRVYGSNLIPGVKYKTFEAAAQANFDVVVMPAVWAPTTKLDWFSDNYECVSKAEPLMTMQNPYFGVDIKIAWSSPADPSGHIFCSAFGSVGGAVTCPAGGNLNSSLDTCTCYPANQDYFDDTKTCQVATPQKAKGQQCGVQTPNPIHLSTGNKYQSDTDYQSSTPGGLLFKRQYNSQEAAYAGTLGRAWRHNFHKLLIPNASGGTAVFMRRPDGNTYKYLVSGLGYTSQDADITHILTALRDVGGAITGWKYQLTDDGSVETYDSAGRLLTVTDRAGVTQTLTYNDSPVLPTIIAPQDGQLIRVSDTLGHQLNFTYATQTAASWGGNTSRINKMVDAAGSQYLYGYDGANNLVSVTYPDGKTKTYHYENAAFPNALTGITDENGVRFPPASD